MALQSGTEMIPVFNIKTDSKTTEVKKGDTILTSSVSFNFPPGYMVGTISEINFDNANGMYLLKVKTSANFTIYNKCMSLKTWTTTNRLS